MNTNKKINRLLPGLLAFVLLISAALPMNAQAASSASIREDINKLEEQEAEIQAKMDELQAQCDANWESIEEMVAYKNNIDEQRFLLYAELDNLDRQIAAYSVMIAETQQKLDEAQAQLDELNIRYKERVRAMEEEGDVSYWSVLFKANSFMDLMDRLNMIQEIAEADQRMLEKLALATEAVRENKAQLEAEKDSLLESRQAQQEAQAEMEANRAEADKLLMELNEDQMALQALHDDAAADKAALAAEIAAAELEYTAAKQAEEEERRRQEEATRPTTPSDDDDDDGEEYTPPPVGESTWMQPCSYICITSAYGYRSSGWHNGVDFAANRGTPIYASRSGTVTKAQSLTYSYGNHVVVNHGDGFSSLYAHMDYFVVSAGQYVTQGQLLGYVGSTGNSTGNHLHFTIFYNGSDVNPMNYL